MTNQDLTQQRALIDALRNPSVYDHPVELCEVVETHISWVILTGEYAYKIKKAVDLGFLDFSTLERRGHFCAEEIRLNGRFAPHFYLERVAITGSVQTPRLNGTGQVLEYAVKMRQFPQAQQLDRLTEAGQLTDALIDRLAEEVALFHGKIEAAPAGTPYGTPETVFEPVAENFVHLDECCTTDASRQQLAILKHWCESNHQRLRATFERRKRDGSVRECHGDLHLANMFQWGDDVVLFDCIEFNPNLRWIDVVSDLAFVTMDLRDRGHPEYARRLLNRYLEHTGDYAGLPVLAFYKVYRATVRAKVACIRLHQAKLSAAQRAEAQGDVDGYLNLAHSFTEMQPPVLLITHGFSGSGKTTLTTALLERMDLIRVRSDIERKRLFGVGALERTDSATDAGIYSAGASEQTYTKLAELAALILESGYSALVDATFLKRSQRERFRSLALRLGAPFLLVDFRAPAHVLRQRISQRQEVGTDASEATTAVLEHQLRSAEPLQHDELEDVVVVDSTRDDVSAMVLQRLVASR